MIANLYGDLLINDRLYRRHGLDMAGIYRAIAQPGSELWSFYLRVYEILWSLERESLAEMTQDAPKPEDDDPIDPPPVCCFTPLREKCWARN